jgi:hypothetical protein
MATYAVERTIDAMTVADPDRSAQAWTGPVDARGVRRPACIG